MYKVLILFTMLFISLVGTAAPLPCINTLRSLQGLHPMDLSRSYLLRVQGTLYGELDPNVLGDGGVVTASLISDGGRANSSGTPNVTFVIFEKEANHHNTTKIDTAFYKGWTFLLLKRSCISEISNKKQTNALKELVSRHLIPPYGSTLKYFSFE